jgi:pseudouridine kinase
MADLLDPQADVLADVSVRARGGPAETMQAPALLFSRPVAPRVACVGGAALFRCYRGTAPIRFGISNPVASVRGFGGVARNVAEQLALLGASASLASRVGDDAHGRALIRHLQVLHVDTSATRVMAGAATAEYSAIVGPDRELVLGLADMAILEAISLADLDRWWPQLSTAAWMFADCNLPQAVLAACVARARDAGARLAVDGVSVPKVMRLPQDMRGIDLLVMNELEAEMLLAARCGVQGLAPGEAAVALRRLGAASVVINLVDRGFVVASADGLLTVPAESHGVPDPRGEDDALAAGLLFRLLEGDDLAEAARFAAHYAARAGMAIAAGLAESLQEA